MIIEVILELCDPENKHLGIWYMNSYLVITLNLPLACTGYILACILPYCHLFSGSVVNHWIKYLCLLLYWATHISPPGLKNLFPSSGNVPSDSPQLSALTIVPGQRTWSLSRGKSASNYWLICWYEGAKTWLSPPSPPPWFRSTLKSLPAPKLPWGWLSPLLWLQLLSLLSPPIFSLPNPAFFPFLMGVNPTGID